MFISPHKFIGGPATPGVLVVKRPSFFRNRVPHRAGRRHGVRRHERAPLPRRTGAAGGGRHARDRRIRSAPGSVFQLKERSAPRSIREREERLCYCALEAWRRNPDIRILGNRDAGGSSIVSFVVRHGRGRSFTTSSSSRCSTTCSASRRAAAAPAPGPTAIACWPSAPIAHGRSKRRSARAATASSPAGPGSTSTTSSRRATAEFIAGAVELIAQSGARLLPDYRFAAESGLWVHEAALARPPLSLLDVGYGADGELRYPRYRDQRGEDSYAETLERAREVLASRPDLPAEDQSGLSAAFEALRWFPLPARCLSAGPSAAPALPAI